LIDDALNQKDYQKAESLLQKTFSSYLGGGANATWYPEKTLLLEERRNYFEKNEEEISGLLELWAIVSNKLGNAKRRAASELQSVMFCAPEDWNAVISEYKKHKNPDVKKAIDVLFTKWQTEMALCSFYHDMDDHLSPDTWIHWLIEAELNIKGKRKWFMEKLNTWFAHLMKDRKSFEKQWYLLARLTKDLPGSGKLKKAYPTFFKVVLPEDSGSSVLGKSRCSALKDMDAGSCLLRTMEVWEKRLRYIVPDPSKAHKSDYSYHAQWMKALYELNRRAYEDMLAQWYEKHNRRRNLWRDMRGLRLPV